MERDVLEPAGLEDAVISNDQPIRETAAAVLTRWLPQTALTKIDLH